MSDPTPAFLNYLDARFVATYWTTSHKRGALNKGEDDSYVVMPSDPWVWSEEYNQKLITNEKAELPIDVKFLDLPMLHSYQEEVSNEFFEALAGCENLEIF